MNEATIWNTGARITRRLLTLLMLAAVVFTVEVSLVPSAAQAQRCDAEQGLRLCRGQYGESCYNWRLESCVSGRICPRFNRVCEGVVCPRDNPNCRPDIADTRSSGEPRVSCFDPEVEVCNRTFAERRVLRCPANQNICDGIYGSECHDPETTSCHAGRICQRFERLCEAPGTARCYNPATNICLVGAVCEIGQQLCRGNYGTTCYDPRSESCFEGVACGRDERLCIGADSQFCHPVGQSCLDR